MSPYIRIQWVMMKLLSLVAMKNIISVLFNIRFALQGYVNTIISNWGVNCKIQIFYPTFCVPLYTASITILYVFFYISL